MKCVTHYIVIFPLFSRKEKGRGVHLPTINLKYPKRFLVPRLTWHCHDAVVGLTRWQTFSLQNVELGWDKSHYDHNDSFLFLQL